MESALYWCFARNTYHTLLSSIHHIQSTRGRVVERSRAWCSSLGVPFFRFSPLLSSEVALNVTDSKIILQMLWETEAYLCSCRDRYSLCSAAGFLPLAVSRCCKPRKEP
ncbi:unnamed protein product [Schistocephalus solidus]|uniref:Secreted protein n=1 Tax=Schistocephalus solidus TaxID=70667 RepID=A0A183SBS7_SCHSO|nr:unnamed protein product [Schistocephalus solidus]